MTSSDTILHDLLARNSRWASDVNAHDASFFDTCAKGQSPKVLWIGCADSRVPESVVLAAKPGEIFVTRNVANQFHADDDSAMSVLSFAVDHLGVEHVIIVGHTQCGGAAAGFSASVQPPSQTAPASPLERWLKPITELARSMKIGSTHTPVAVAQLVDENVRVQVQNVCDTDVIQRTWQGKGPKGKKVQVHGWVFDIEKGRLRDLGCSKGT